MRSHRRQKFDLFCPSDGTFFACASGTRFVGCCTVDPCSVPCPSENLKPVSFNIDAFDKLPDQQCPSSSQWFKCRDTNPSFIGCCASNPCVNNGCPDGELVAGFLDSNSVAAAPFLSAGGSSTSTTLSTAKPTPTPPDTLVHSSPSPSSTSQPSHQSNPSAIAGGVVGGLAVVAILIFIAVFFKFRPKKIPGPWEPMSRGAERSDKGYATISEMPSTHEAPHERLEGLTNSNSGYQGMVDVCLHRPFIILIQP